MDARQLHRVSRLARGGEGEAIVALVRLAVASAGRGQRRRHVCPCACGRIAARPGLGERQLSEARGVLHLAPAPQRRAEPARNECIVGRHRFLIDRRRERPRRRLRLPAQIEQRPVAPRGRRRQRSVGGAPFDPGKQLHRGVPLAGGHERVGPDHLELQIAVRLETAKDLRHEHSRSAGHQPATDAS